jgi:hypothetical protein
MTKRLYSYHYEKSILVPKTQLEVFEFVDDHQKFSSHMNEPSGMMMGSRMKTIIDNDHFQKVGSHLQMEGKVLGINLFLDEVVTERLSPNIKVWETVGTPKLLVVGDYKMTVKVSSKSNESLLTVSIDYDLPNSNKWLGILFGKFYAKWCVGLMVNGVKTLVK